MDSDGQTLLKLVGQSHLQDDGHYDDDGDYGVHDDDNDLKNADDDDDQCLRFIRTGDKSEQYDRLWRCL